MKIELNSPVAPDLQKLNYHLGRVNESGWYTNFGPLHQELTKRLEAYLGVENLLLVSNGTLALQVAYIALGIKSAVTTPFSFVATTSSLLWQNIPTQFCDIDKQSYNLSPEKVEKALMQDSTIDGIVATHVYGNPCDVNAFEKLSESYNVKVIYDSAHAFGITLGNKSILNFGDASTLSFHATKVFHTIEGGAIVFKRKEDFEKAKQLINFGITNGEVIDVGINAKLNEYQCAVGLTLLDSIDDIIEKRTELFSLYKEGLSGIIDMPYWHDLANTNGAYFPIVFSSERQFSNVCGALTNNNIQFRPYFRPSLDVVFPAIKHSGLSISNRISELVLCLPLHFNLNKSDVLKVIETIKRALV